MTEIKETLWVIYIRRRNGFSDRLDKGMTLMFWNVGKRQFENLVSWLPTVYTQYLSIGWVLVRRVTTFPIHLTSTDSVSLWLSESDERNCCISACALRKRMYYGFHLSCRYDKNKLWNSKHCCLNIFSFYCEEFAVKNYYEDTLIPASLVLAMFASVLPVT